MMNVFTSTRNCTEIREHCNKFASSGPTSSLRACEFTGVSQQGIKCSKNSKYPPILPHAYRYKYKKIYASVYPRIPAQHIFYDSLQC